MFGIFFAVLVAMALLNACGEITMRVRLTRKENSRDKLVWWRRGGDEVVATYEQLFPSSPLPFFRRWVFWSFVVFAAMVLATILWKMH